MAAVNHPDHNNQREEARSVAKLWARHGIPAFPIRIGYDQTLYDGAGGTTKRPANQHGHNEATCNIDDIDRQFDEATCGSGEVFGAGILPGGGECVTIDIDRKGGRNGYVAADHLGLMDTWGASTPSGGEHRIFRRPKGIRIGNRSPWEGIDIRGDDGWIVAPGTKTPWGNWRKIDDGRTWPQDVADLPAEVLAQLTTTSADRPTSGTWRHYNNQNAELLDPATREAVEALHQLGGHDTVIRTAEGREPWAETCRPGKRHGTSASVGYIAPGIIRSFTPNWPGVPEGRNELADNNTIVPAGHKLETWLDSLTTQPTQPPTHVNPETGEIVGDEETDTWHPISLRHDPDRQAVTPTILQRDDSEALFTRGHVHVLFGEPEAGKGWLICTAIAETVRSGENAVYIDLEDTEHNIGPRLRGLGLTDDELEQHVTYLRPQERATRDVWQRIKAVCADATLVVVDSFNEVIGLWGLKSKDNDEITPFVRNVPRALAYLGPAVVLADHVVKNREDRGRYPIGAQAKLAAVDAGFMVENTTRFGRGKTGRSTISVAKDRHGHVRAATIGDDHWGTFTLHSDENGDITHELVARVGTDTAPAFRPTFLMEKVSGLLARPENAGGMSQTAIENAIGSKAEHVRQAIEILVAEGYCTRVDGKRKAKIATFVRPYRQADELDPVSPSRPRPGTGTGYPVSPSTPSTNGRGDGDGVVGGETCTTPSRPLCTDCGHTLDRGGICHWCHIETTDDWIDPRKDTR